MFYCLGHAFFHTFLRWGRRGWQGLSSRAWGAGAWNYYHIIPGLWAQRDYSNALRSAHPAPAATFLNTLCTERTLLLKICQIYSCIIRWCRHVADKQLTENVMLIHALILAFAVRIYTRLFIQCRWVAAFLTQDEVRFLHTNTEVPGPFHAIDMRLLAFDRSDQHVDSTS